MIKNISIMLIISALIFAGCQPQTINPTDTTSGDCPSDGTTGLQVLYIDDLSSALSYLAPVVYATPVTNDANLERVTAGTLQTDGTYSSATDLKCLESGTKWQITAVSLQDSAQSVIGPIITARGSEAKVKLEGKAFDSLQFRVEDKFTGGRQYFDIANCGTTNTGWHSFGGTQCTVQDISGNTALTLATDGYIEARLYLKTNHTKKIFGEDGLNTWLLADADTSEFAPIEVYLQGDRTQLENQIGSLNSEDRRKYSGYEYMFDIGQRGERETYLDIYMESTAGVNPSTDPVFDICSEGRYNSNKERDTILVGCWTDASSQVQVTTGTLHQFKFDIS